MAFYKDVLVLTTPTIEGAVVKKYLRPVSAHLVAGTNIINDFFGSLSDVFGGRSGAYQKQLRTLYNDAVDRVKIEAFEIGANCVLGLRIDMDEIAGKGKSMFMLTAVGTAVYIEHPKIEVKRSLDFSERVEVVNIDVLKLRRERKGIISKALNSTLNLDEGMWQFLTENQVHEVFNALVKTIPAAINREASYPRFIERFLAYVEALPYEVKLDKLYWHIASENENEIVRTLMEMVQKLYLFDYVRCMELLRNDSFHVRKRGLALVVFDKAYYNSQDLIELEVLRNYLKEIFVERGAKTTKKQLLSSKEKDVWTCECKKTNDAGSYCSGCGQDIYGFKSSDVKPVTVDTVLLEKIALIKEFIETSSISE